MNWNKMVKMTVPVGLCGWQQRGSLTINGRTTEFPVGVETELPEPVAERIKALIADAEEKAEHVQPLKPWMQHVTGADGVARWEPRLAYEASTEEVILPDETVNNIAYGRTWVSCPNASKIQIGNTGTFYINGKAYPYVAIEYSNSSWPSISVQLKLDGKSGLMAVDGNKLMFYDMLVTPPGGSAIISIVKNSTTIKPLDQKYLPSGSGGGGVMYISGLESLIVPAYADDALTTMLSYDQAKEIIQKPFAVRITLEGTTGAMYPVMAFGDDSLKKVNMIVITPEAGAAAGMTLTFSDTPES